jgi:hypothetical protein
MEERTPSPQLANQEIGRLTRFEEKVPQAAPSPDPAPSSSRRAKQEQEAQVESIRVDLPNFDQPDQWQLAKPPWQEGMLMVDYRGQWTPAHEVEQAGYCITQ